MNKGDFLNSAPMLDTAGIPKRNRPMAEMREGIEVRYEFPPIYDRILRAFPHAKDNKAVIFTFGDVVYVPYRVHVDRALLEHEKVHALQQVAGPGAWWDRYIDDLTFRFEQELEAHRAEYQTRYRLFPKHKRVVVLMDVAQKLSSPLYGNLVTMAEAMRMLRQNQDGRGSSPSG